MPILSRQFRLDVDQEGKSIGMTEWGVKGGIEDTEGI